VEFGIKDLSCTLFPGRFPNGEIVPDLYNKSYLHWKQTWGEIFSRAGSPESLQVNNFLRQDVVACLSFNNQIAGLFTSTFFNASATLTFDHPYLHPFPDGLIQQLREQNRGIICTAEYFSLDSEFRKSALGVSLSEVLAGIALKVFISQGAVAMLGTAVRPAGVHRIGEKFGWSEIGGIQKYGLDCVLIYNNLKQAHEIDDPVISKAVDHLWNKRLDMTGLTQSNVTPIRRAA
jgi:hypothetical protein